MFLFINGPPIAEMLNNYTEEGDDKNEIDLDNFLQKIPHNQGPLLLMKARKVMIITYL